MMFCSVRKLSFLYHVASYLMAASVPAITSAANTQEGEKTENRECTNILYGCFSVTAHHFYLYHFDLLFLSFKGSLKAKSFS